MAALLCLLIAPVMAASKTSQKELLLAKHYVLTGCIIERYPNTPLANEADAWAAVLVEDGSLSMEKYLALAKLSKSAPTPLMTQFGVVLRLESCINYVERIDVVERIKKIIGR